MNPAAFVNLGGYLVRKDMTVEQITREAREFWIVVLVVDRGRPVLTLEVRK